MRRSIIISTLAVLALGASAANAQNLLTNGNFEAGNTGFLTQYGVSQPFPPGPDGPGFYNVYNNTLQFNPVFGQTFGDHTTGQGLMMVVNGATTPNTYFWGQNVGVVQNTTYTFSGWFASALINPDPNPAIISLSINGGAVGAGFNVGATTGAWTQFTTTWNSGTSTVANIRLFDANLTNNGNDFVADDFSFRAPSVAPEPGSLALIGLAALPLAGLLRRRK
jgi:hypothetical protein